MCCFANETVTTVVYTDCHTRPLHEARPILFQTEPGTVQALRATRLNLDPRRSGPPADPHGRARQIELDLTAGRDRSRSAEHTAELQSLMRISSAVFCLTTTTHTLHGSLHIRSLLINEYFVLCHTREI